MRFHLCELRLDSQILCIEKKPFPHQIADVGQPFFCLPS
jgi:hypothetical protein